MAINIIQIQRWAKMLVGRSVEHVNQSIGKVYSKNEIRGYYNDLTEKVTIDKSFLNNNDLPLIKQLDGQSIHFPVAIFQYALGCYDLWLIENNEVYINKFIQCAEWTLNKLDDEGRWDNFSHVYPEAPYGAMAQGEGVSVLVRAYIYSGDSKYLAAAKKAIDFMLTDLRVGGTTEYFGEDVVFWEYTNQPVVMNGWIFAWWGLYDYVLAIKDRGLYKAKLDKSRKSLLAVLPRFKNSYWSLYDLNGKFASPFYHNLHIAQMQAMYDITGDIVFKEYADCWEKQYRNVLYKSLAFIVKAIQKIRE
nr:D-glucuronyl C5-epimerase family protein [uncultured Bacteroides sp.]